MPRLLPQSPRNLVKMLKSLGFEGPFTGGKHPCMKQGSLYIPIPNIHGGKDVPVGIIEAIIEEIGYTKKEWIELQSKI